MSDSPFTDLVGIHPSDPSDTTRQGEDGGRAVTTSDQHANMNGTVHGGLIATLLDAVMGEASRRDLDDDKTAATVSMTVTYLTAGEIGDELKASAETRKEGGKLVMVEGDVTSARTGEPIAHGVATYVVLDKEKVGGDKG